MKIEPVPVHTVSLETRYSGIMDELHVTAEVHDREYPPDPDYSLYDVQPSTIAMLGTTTPGGAMSGVPGLRVGVFVVTQIELGQGGVGVPTVDVLLGNGLSFYHQLAGVSAEVQEYPDWFQGFTIRWGDSTVNWVNTISTESHTYPALGTYDVRVELVFAEDVPWISHLRPAATRRVTLS